MQPVWCLLALALQAYSTSALIVAIPVAPLAANASGATQFAAALANATQAAALAGLLHHLGHGLGLRVRAGTGWTDKVLGLGRPVV